MNRRTSMPDETMIRGIGGDWAAHQVWKSRNPGSSLISSRLKNEVRMLVLAPVRSRDNAKAEEQWGARLRGVPRSVSFRLDPFSCTRTLPSDRDSLIKLKVVSHRLERDPEGITETVLARPNFVPQRTTGHGPETVRIN